MKKNSMLLAAAMTFSTVAAMANPFSDVPASHWAFDAVNKLTSNGILQGYPDGTFKGEKNVTRYHLAMVVAKMLSNVEQMMGNGTGTNFVTKADLQTLEKLTVEFADELALLGVKVTALEDDMQVVKEDVAGVKKDVEAIKSHMANGGMEKVAISGDMIVAHFDQVKVKNGEVKVGDEKCEGKKRGFGFGQKTKAQFRLRFDAKIDENIEAAVRTTVYADEYGTNLGGAAGAGTRELSKNGTTQNDVDVAYINMKNMLFKGNLKIGRDYMSHGSALLLNDYVDAVSYSKMAGKVAFEINAIYNQTESKLKSADKRNDRQIWNLNLGYEVKGHDLRLGYYTQDYSYGKDSVKTPYKYGSGELKDKDLTRSYLEFDAKGELGNNGNFSYELAYIMSDEDKALVNAETNKLENAKGNLYHVAFKYDTKDAFAVKLGYTAGDEEYKGGISDNKAGYHHMYDDENRTPLEDLCFMGYGDMQDAENLKVELFYNPVNSKHGLRVAYDMYKQDENKKYYKNTGLRNTGNSVDTQIKDEANIVTVEYKYQLSENTKLRLGYVTLDGKKASKDADDDRFFAEIYSRF